MSEGRERVSDPVAQYAAILAELDAKAKNAARRGKPTMWAYYRTMTSGLAAWFGDVPATDGAYAGAALALSQRSDRCALAVPDEAARTWALGVYARRILGAWGAGSGERVSLDWLRQREGVSRGRG